MFDGASPYVCVNKILDGSKAKFNLLLPSLSPKPILSGFGIICSSSLSETPAPKDICKVPSDKNLDTNLFETLFNFNK